MAGTVLRARKWPPKSRFTYCRNRDLGPRAALETGAVEDAAGDLLDGEFRGVDVGNAVAAEQLLRLAQFVAHLLGAGVAALRAAFAADLLQPRGCDGQPEQFLPVLQQEPGQLPALEFLLGEREIR